MEIKFSKYQGTGNDFILIDNRKGIFPSGKISDLVPKMCDRKFGIGSDGLVLVNNLPEVDYEMIFFNPDGSQSLCGNASRCTFAFAKKIGIIETNHASFQAIDGIHQIKQIEQTVHFQLNNIDNVEKIDEKNYFVNTGSPHHILVVDNIEKIDIISEGQKIRFSNKYQSQNGTNVNFIELKDDFILARTYERGVENETLSCGTGVTAIGLAANYFGYASPVNIHTKGGKLSVTYDKTEDNFKNIWLAGPAKEVFEGIYKY